MKLHLQLPIAALFLISGLALNGCTTSKPANESAPPAASASPTATPTPLAEASPEAKGEGTLKTTPSGLKYQDLIVGTGQRPLFGQTVLVRYTGWTEDGIKFDSNETGAKPSEQIILGKGEVIKGWELGIGGGKEIEPMRVGGRRKLIIPPALGYGSNPMGTIPPNSTLVFEVQLLGVKGGLFGTK